LSAAGWDIALPFDRDDPNFCLGVEVGRLWEQLKGDEGFGQTFHAENAEMVLRMVERTGRVFCARELDLNWMHVEVEAR